MTEDALPRLFALRQSDPEDDDDTNGWISVWGLEFSDGTAVGLRRDHEQLAAPAIYISTSAERIAERYHCGYIMEVLWPYEDGPHRKDHFSEIPTDFKAPRSS